MALCPSVCPSVTSLCCIGTAEQIELGFSTEAKLSYVPTLCYKGILVCPKIRVLPLGNLSQTLELSSVHTIPVCTDRVHGPCWSRW